MYEGDYGCGAAPDGFSHTAIVACRLRSDGLARGANNA